MQRSQGPVAGCDFAAIETAVGDCGLIPRGGFRPRAEDAVPPLPDGPPGA